VEAPVAVSLLTSLPSLRAEGVAAEEGAQEEEEEEEGREGRREGAVAVAH